MISQHARFVIRAERLTDNLIIMSSFFAAYTWRDLLGGQMLAPISEYGVVLLVGLIFYNTLLTLMGGYGRLSSQSTGRFLPLVVAASAITFFSIGAVLFILKLDLSRLFIGLFCVTSFLGLVLSRALLSRFLCLWMRRSRNFRNVVVCGAGEQARSIINQIKLSPHLGIRLVALAELSEKLEQMQALSGLQKESDVDASFISVEDLAQGLKKHSIDEVIFTDISTQVAKIEEAVCLCAEEGVHTSLAADLFRLGMTRSKVSYFGSMPLIHFQAPPGDQWELTAKRSIDVMLSSAALLALSPAFICIAALVKLTSKGPVFFKQKRVGLNGRIFSMYKFRSMSFDAEQMQDELWDKNEMSGPVFKMTQDPRVTSIGTWLRRHSIDELPQLFNVLRGEMSLVGPRPPIPFEVDAYVRKYRRRLSMRPGLTCLWQISGRNDLKDFDTWMRLDLEYIDNWSLLKDFLIMIRTVPAVLFGQGAR